MRPLTLEEGREPGPGVRLRSWATQRGRSVGGSREGGWGPAFVFRTRRRRQDTPRRAWGAVAAGAGLEGPSRANRDGPASLCLQRLRVRGRPGLVLRAGQQRQALGRGTPDGGPAHGAAFQPRGRGQVSKPWAPR